MVPSMRAWGLHQVTTKAVEAVLARLVGRGPSASCSGGCSLVRSKPMPMASTMTLPTRRTTIPTAGKASIIAPTPKKQARAKETSKNTTTRAVSRARRRGWLRAALMTNRFWTPMGAT